MSLDINYSPCFTKLLRNIHGNMKLKPKAKAELSKILNVFNTKIIEMFAEECSSIWTSNDQMLAIQRVTETKLGTGSLKTHAFYRANSEVLKLNGGTPVCKSPATMTGYTDLTHAKGHMEDHGPGVPGRFVLDKVEDEGAEVKEEAGRKEEPPVELQSKEEAELTEDKSPVSIIFQEMCPGGIVEPKVEQLISSTADALTRLLVQELQKVYGATDLIHALHVKKIVQYIFPSVLAEHAFSEGAKAVRLYRLGILEVPEWGMPMNDKPEIEEENNQLSANGESPPDAEEYQNTNDEITEMEVDD